MNPQELWRAVLGELEISISKANFQTWFGQTRLSSAENGVVTIVVPNTMAQKWLDDKYRKDIISSLERIMGQAVQRIIFTVDTTNKPQVSVPQSVINHQQSVQQANPNISSAPRQPTPMRNMPTTHNGQTSVTDRIEAKNKFGLNPRYTFDSFIVGKTNELAHAAAQAAANRPGEVYNPLFVYGGVGLGKTHLIQAIGNRISANNPDVRILYISSERFTNEFVAAIRSGSIKQFKETYRNIDLLLIDDIQFIAGKTETQEEFFHTFNELHQANRQIVMTSDRPPKAIPGLEDRLRSRFEWGMIVDVASPDLETRVAILESKCLEKKCTLSKDVLQTVATLVKSNIRELEGALNKILAHQDLRHEMATVESVKGLLTGYEDQSYKKSLTPKDLVVVISQYFDISIDEIMSANREKRLSFPRQIIMYLLREELKCSFPSIGQELGGRDHTTAMHAYEKISKEVENNMKLKQDIAAIRQRLYSITQG